MSGDFFVGNGSGVIDCYIEGVLRNERARQLEIRKEDYKRYCEDRDKTFERIKQLYTETEELYTKIEELHDEIGHLTLEIGEAKNAIKLLRHNFRVTEDSFLLATKANRGLIKLLKKHGIYEEVKSV